MSFKSSKSHGNLTVRNCTEIEEFENVPKCAKNLKNSSDLKIVRKPAKTCQNLPKRPETCINVRKCGKNLKIAS